MSRLYEARDHRYKQDIIETRSRHHRDTRTTAYIRGPSPSNREGSSRGLFLFCCVSDCSVNYDTQWQKRDRYPTYVDTCDHRSVWPIVISRNTSDEMHYITDRFNTTWYKDRSLFELWTSSTFRKRFKGSKHSSPNFSVNIIFFFCWSKLPENHHRYHISKLLFVSASKEATASSSDK